MHQLDICSVFQYGFQFDNIMKFSCLGPTGPPTTTQTPQNVIIPERSWMYQDTKMTPNPGPLGDARYIPGTPGSQWTKEEVLSTRLRIFQMIHPTWTVRKDQGTWNGLGAQTSIVSRQ